jgi:hypothetical protein
MEPDDLVGASMVVGLTFVENDQSERYETYAGHVRETRAADDGFNSLDDNSNPPVIVIECHDGETREFPFDNEAIEPADPGIYKLPDGTTVENPDYQMLWRITAPIRN